MIDWLDGEAWQKLNSLGEHMKRNSSLLCDCLCGVLRHTHHSAPQRCLQSTRKERRRHMLALALQGSPSVNKVKSRDG